ncbi:DUF4411 family protein [Corynebacterium nasicanis]|uniref:DUF4411 family protein n=1 Tax=Corynebacterium nasicanis TaxID=1448267 RepID=A0ABW1QCP0_9CORY
MYLIDSNLLINASRTYYAPDLAPFYWEWMIEQAEKGAVASISQVKDELNKGDPKDFLRSWSHRLPDEFWLEPLVEAASSYQEIFEWVSDRQRPYSSAAITQFFAAADSSLIAMAQTRGLRIVTFEKSAPQAKNRVLIPDVCNALGVAYCDGFTMYRELGLRFS